MHSPANVTDIMTKDAIVVTTSTPLVEAAEILNVHKINGVPVVDGDNILVGILTEYDLISKGSAIHLPTLQAIFQNLSVMREDRSRFEKETREIMSLTVKDVMNDDPLTLPLDASFDDVVAAFRDHHRVNPIPVIDKNRKVVGVVSRCDVLKLFHALK